MVTKIKNSAGFVHVILISIAALLAVAIIGYLVHHQVQVNNERKLFAQADKEAQAYINAIAAKYPGRVIVDNRCSRTSAKFDNGSLGCSTEAYIEVVLDNNLKEDDIVSFANEQKILIPWEQTYMHKGSGSTSPNELEIYIYNFENKTCSTVYEYKQVGSGANSHDLILDKGNKILVISAGCSGPAMTEYYK